MEMPWPACVPQTSAAQLSLRRLAASIAVANGLASSGRAIDLGGLDAVAGLLCAQVLDLPPADGATLRPAINSLHAEIGELVMILKTSGQSELKRSSN